MSDGHPVGCRLHRAQQQQWVHGVHRVQFFQDMLNILKSHCLVEAQWFDLVGVHFSLCNEVESVDSELLGNPLLDPHHFQPRQVITTKKGLFWCNTIPWNKMKLTLQRQIRLSALASFLLNADYTFVFLQVFFSSKVWKVHKLQARLLFAGAVAS